MKKVLYIFLVSVMILLISVPTFAINTPVVSQGHGVLLGMFVSDEGIVIGGEYGLTPELGLTGKIGDHGLKLAGKYEISSSLGVLAGVYDNAPFIGINGARWINSYVTGLYELDVAMRGTSLSFIYEIGLKYKLSPQIDIRGGCIGSISTNIKAPALEIGLGYHF